MRQRSRQRVLSTKAQKPLQELAFPAIERTVTVLFCDENTDCTLSKEIILDYSALYIFLIVSDSSTTPKTGVYLTFVECLLITLGGFDCVPQKFSALALKANMTLFVTCDPFPTKLHPPNHATNRLL